VIDEIPQLQPVEGSSSCRSDGFCLLSLLKFWIMTIYINSDKVEVPVGMTIGDAVKSYSHELFQKLTRGQIKVYDRFGNQTEPDGPLKAGQQLVLK